jgi:UDP-N-acetylmuramyl pentapeptide phosphotransferase/UDP-N-acetylglucosamine-1-phosphate transferase
MFIYLLSLVIIILFINRFFLYKKILINETGDIHQKFASKSKIPLTGGLFIFIGYLYFLDNNILSFIFFSFTIFILGIFSDLKLIKDASFKFILQVVIIISYAVFNDMQIHDTRIFFLDKILLNDLVNYLFVTFCILIVINGSNFIDGMNTLSLGHYLSISIIIFYLYINQIISINNISILYILVLLSLAFVMNFFNQLFLGDSGSYLLGFSFSVFLINIYNWNSIISPFFIILLLWYPCYENLFSILRKNILKKSPMSPDAKHMHQLIFFFIKKEYKLSIISANLLTAQIINIYNFCIFFIGVKFISNSQIQAFLILFSIIIYTTIYFKLFIFKYKKEV